MLILAIETSCDETAVALLDISGEPKNLDIKVLGNSLYSQIHIHKEYGGVYPMLAKREHEKNLPILLEKTLKEAGFENKIDEIDFITVTQGPGLEPALWTGISFAQNLGNEWNIPVVPVDHMEGHIWSVLYKQGQIKLPALALLISGGHTELVLIKDFGQYTILGRTRDDAVGEAFDKVARMLDLPYPGGPKISKLAEIDREKHPEPRMEFPRPMIRSGDFDFSYSGLKTAVLYKIRDLEITEEKKEEVARAFEDAAVDVLISKTEKALDYHSETKTVLAAGGVAANEFIRFRLGKLLDKFPEKRLVFPQRELSTDNAIMIGIAGYIRNYLDPKLGKISDIKAKGNLSL